MLEYINFTVEVTDVMTVTVYLECNETEMWKNVIINGETISEGPVALNTEVKAWLRELEDLEIHKWSSIYSDDDQEEETHILWHIDYKRKDKRCRHITGYDNYPLDWDDFLYLIDEIAPESQMIYDERLEEFSLNYYYEVAQGTKDAWMYKENLTCQRREKTIAYERRVFDACIIRYECFAKMVVSHVLDMVEDILVDCEFAKYQSNPPKPCILLNLTYHDGTQVTHYVPYNRRSLPDEWHLIIDSIAHLMSSYGLFGDIFNFQYYDHGVKDDEFIYCSVAFEENGKTYYYQTTDDGLMIGDEVIVPVGEDNEEKIGWIEDINYYYAENVPYPLEKTKSIIEKYSEHDHDFNDYLKSVS